MTFALWMILVAAILPLVATGIAKSGASGYDNARPRAWSAQQTGWRSRADAAHRNGFEAFPPFAAAVLVAQFTRAPQSTTDLLAAGFIMFRIGYIVAYIRDIPNLRSTLWALGFFCVIALFCVGI